MARPRRIELPEGKVLLYGFPKELANELEVYISKFKPAEKVINVPVEITEPVAKPIKQYPHKALGLREKSPRQWEVVVVGYDDKEAGIEEIKNAGDFKQHAMSVFQQEIFKRGLV